MRGARVLTPHMIKGASTRSCACANDHDALDQTRAARVWSSKVGNFVEIKKSTIGQGSKVNHLSYVGDATVGTGVNIGAGVITCNYDGANKSQTIIEDNAFIGSNASLVAPVTIGDTATVAAGSVITKDVDSSALAFGRARQVQKNDFQRPTKK